MGEWHQHKLADLGQIVTGKTPPTSNPDFYGGNVPFVTPTDMDLRRTIDCTLRNLSELGAKKVKSSYIKNPAIVVSCIGSDMGKAALVDKPFVSNQQINSVIVRESFDRLFVYYNLSARKTEIRANANGAAQPIMNKTDFGNLTINVPDLDIQQAISCVLSALDDKIELNRRMNATLEGLARALFADWFVDFGPTRAKMALSAKGAKNAQTKPYLAPEIWSLFPDRLDEDGVPEGWEKKPLGDCLTRLKVGKLYDKKTVKVNGTVPVLDQGKSGIIGFHNYEPNIHASSERRVAIFANHTCLMRLLDFNFSTIQNVIPFVGNKFPTEWVYYATLGKQSFEEYRGHWPSFVAHDVVVPHMRLAEEYSMIVDPLLLKISANTAESRTLTQTRDLLLPKLMSGALRVRTAEGVLEEIA